MNFIYDIVLNFNKDFYNFFEWNKNDNIINVKKIPIFLIDNDTFIKDKTYTYTRSKLGISCLISNNKEVIAVLFNDNGNLIKRSSLMLDEEEEVLDEIENDSLYKINIIKRRKVNIENVNRNIKEKKDFLIKYINEEKNDINLKYLYYDYFEKDENNIKIIKNELIKEIKNNWNKKLNNFYDTVKIFKKIKN